MISYQEALSTVLSHALPLETVRMELGQLLGYFLAQPVVAKTDFPIFDNSAVDGFGVRVADVQQASPDSHARLRMKGTVRAGDAVVGELTTGMAVKVLTGAPLPLGVEAVVMKEFCYEAEGKVFVEQAIRLGENIRRQGEEFRQGHQALPSGIRITPAVIGLLATFGYSGFPVHRKPKVALIVTGDELVRPGQPLRAGQIYDSNSYLLAAALQAMGLNESTLASTADDPKAIMAQLSHALRSADVVITVGGISVGDYDFVKEGCAALSVNTHFWKVAIKPGKPFYFGTFTDGEGKREKLVFGLPGNPVAALLTFQQLVKPALLKMMGAGDISTFLLNATLAADLEKKAGRTEFARGVTTVENGQLVVRPTAGQDSHMLGGLAQANCIIQLPDSEQHLAKGDNVLIEFLRWD